MILNKQIVYLLALLSLANCGPRGNNTTNNRIPHNPGYTKDTLKPYLVKSQFLDYMPDTTIRFESDSERSRYIFERHRHYREYKQSLDNSLKTSLQIQNADIMFDDYTMLLNYNYIKSRKTNLELLIFYSPYSQLVPLESVRSLFNSFPKSKRDSEIGKKINKHLTEMEFQSGKIKNFSELPSLLVTDTSYKQRAITFPDFPKKKFTLLSFGASWCLPCRLGEVQLVEWKEFIDTSRINIISLSIDKENSKWKKSIRDDKIFWDAFKIENEMKNNWIQMLEFESVPMIYLLDSNGTILYRNTDIRKVLVRIPGLVSNINYVEK